MTTTHYIGFGLVAELLKVASLQERNAADSNICYVTLSSKSGTAPSPLVYYSVSIHIVRGDNVLYALMNVGSTFSNPDSDDPILKRARQIYTITTQYLQSKGWLVIDGAVAMPENYTRLRTNFEFLRWEKESQQFTLADDDGENTLSSVKEG